MLKLTRRGDAHTQWPKPMGMDETLYALLAARGIHSDDAALKFLNPSPAHLHDPFRLNDMERAVTRITAAKQNGETVCVYGDYDVDGVSAAAMLTLFLKEWGVVARPYIPSRHGEGYGLNESAVTEIAKWAQLMITVDCGITGGPEVELAKSLALDVVVTDHHEPGETLPDCPVIDPLLNNYPFPKLCGAGVAFKLMTALKGELPVEYVDLAALATVADIVPLIDENRVLVSMGLKQINFRPRPGILALIEASGLKEKAISSQNIAYQLGPRLNAGGRMGDANRSFHLLMAGTMDEAVPLARELNEENQNRRAIEGKILDEAMDKLKIFDFLTHKAIVLWGEEWNVGVIGICASRIVEKYNFPVILLSEQNGVLTGSCRSIPGVDIHAALTYASDLLVRFGGHVQAAGLTIDKEKLPAFIDRIDQYITAACDPEDYIPGMDYDLEIALESLSEKMVKELSRLEPTGFGNQPPVFLSEARIASTKAIGRDQKHLKLWLTIPGGKPLDAVWFGAGHLAGPLCGATRKLLYEPQINDFMGSRTVQCMVQSAADPDDIAWPDGAAWTLLMHDFLTSALYNSVLFTVDQFAPMDAQKGGDYLDALRNSPRGTLLIAATLEAAKAAESAIRAAGLLDRIDCTFGAWPDDPRGFNALCILPTGDAPRGYDTCFLLDAPAHLANAPDSAERFSQENAPRGWLNELPETDDLRIVYVAAKKLFSRPYYIGSLERLLEMVAEESDLSQVAILASLLALHDMQLIRFQARPPEVTLRPVRKINPEDNRLFQRIGTIKNG